MRTDTRITSRRSPRMRFSLAVLAMAASFLLLGGPATPAAAATGSITTTLEAARALPASYFGVNYDYQTVAPFMNDPNRPAQVAALSPGTIRWPGGVEANSFDWWTGQPMAPASNGFQFKLKELFNAWQATVQTSNADAAPMFDLNVVTRSISDQVTMLQTAQSMGMPIRYVELGNELSSKPDLFANGTVYGATVAADVKALKAQFPAVKVAADGFLGHLGQTPTPTEKTWNHDMLTSASANGGVPDAVILHAYAPPPPGDLTTSNLGTLFGSAYDELGLLDTVISAFPTLPAPATQPAVWVTEYNLGPSDSAPNNPPQATYAHGLFAAAYGLLLRETPRATHNDLWTAFGGAAFGSWQGDATTQFVSPQGLALTWVAGAAAVADSSTRIDFPGGPTLPDGNPALVGYGFSAGGGASRAVLVNLSEQAVTVPSSSAVPAGASFQFVTGHPIEQVANAADLTHGSGTVGSTITLQPYSITLVG